MKCPKCKNTMKEQINRENHRVFWICQKCCKTYFFRGGKLTEWRY